MARFYTYLGSTPDSRDRLIQTTNAAGDAASFEYDDAGNLLSTTDELERTTSFQYDALNRQTQVSDPLNHQTSAKYDAVGNLVSTTDANGNVTELAYDALNRPQTITNALGDKVTTEYDAVGNVTSVTDELGRKTKFTYDDRDLPTSITDPLNQTSTTEYDAVGNVVSLSDPLGNKTTYGYDQIYRLTNQTDAEGRKTKYQFDSVGNLISLTDPEDNTTTYTHDALNRLITDTNQLGDTRTYEYDAVGNQIASVDRNGREINYLFDNLNRNTKEVWLDEAGNPVRTFDFKYDAASQLLKASDPNSAYGYTYDQDGRVTKVDNAGTPGVPNVVLGYTYDRVDNLTQVTDKIDGVAKGVENFTYDPLDRVTKITQSGNGVSEKRVDMSYDAASQMTGMSRYSDLTGNDLIAQSTYTFDDAGRLTNLTHDQDGDVLSAYEWAYDQANRITQATLPDGVSEFSYDKSDQLVDADHSYQDDEAYSYDENGNRVNDGYVTGENNQLQSDGTFNYEYDQEGNRVKRTEIATGEVTNYEWDYRNRLVGVETKNSDGDVTANAEYTYDVFDNRIAKSVDADGDGAGVAVVERFVYDGDHIALTFDGEGHQTERFLHGTQIDQVLAQENANGEVLWALTDHQGSVRMLLDNDGNVVNNITYDAFGNITVESNPDVNFRFSYTGRELDSETGLYNYRSRYYDPGVGEFVSEDRIGFAGGDANLSRYVANSPVNYIDPFGDRTIAPVRPPIRTPRAIPSPTPRPTINPNSPFNPSTPTKNPPGYFPYENNDPSVPFKFPVIEPLEPDPSDPYNTNDWYEKAKKLLEDIEEQNQRQQEDNGGSNQGASCSVGDKGDYSAPEASGDDNGNNSDSGDGQDYLTSEEFDTLPSNGTIDPDRIRFSQDSINYRFKKPYENQTVDDLIEKIKNNEIDPKNLDPIRIVEKDGNIYTLDNRRLYTHQQAEKPINYQKLDHIPKRQQFKFTTKNNGTSIDVIGK